MYVYCYSNSGAIYAKGLFKTTEKMIGCHTRFKENGDLPPWRGPAVKKKLPFSNAHALITRKIMRSRDAQCNTGE